MVIELTRYKIYEVKKVKCIGLLNYSTKKEAEESAEEIKTKLLFHDVQDVKFDFNEEIASIEFIRVKLKTKSEIESYKISTKIDPVYKVLRDQNWSGEIKIAITHSQAKRVAWRIAKRWIDAQLAFVETGMLSFEEVFLSYKLDEGTGLSPIEEYQTKQLMLASDDDKLDFPTVT